MTGLLAIVLLGFLLGMRHACDADHVVAISAIVARRPSLTGAAVIGMVWGVGHTLTIMIVGVAIIVFSVAIPPRIGLSMELSVGFMLIALGAMNLTGLTHRIFHRFAKATDDPPHRHASLIHSHAHSHGEVRHSHSHFHLLATHRNAARGLGRFDVLRPLAVGIVHGLAGSAATALLVMSTIRDPAWAVAYLLLFGLGTIAGMMLITLGIAAPFVMSARAQRTLALGSGLLSLSFGLLIVYQIGFAGGLFTGTPRWTPH
jgi:high-affinity nickel permease